MNTVPLFDTLSGLHLDKCYRRAFNGAALLKKGILIMYIYDGKNPERDAFAKGYEAALMDAAEQCGDFEYEDTYCKFSERMKELDYRGFFNVLCVALESIGVTKTDMKRIEKKEYAILQTLQEDGAFSCFDELLYNACFETAQQCEDEVQSIVCEGDFMQIDKAFINLF